MKELKLNELVIVKGRCYRITETPNSNGVNKWKRITLKILRQGELNKEILKQLKGGLKE